MQKTTQGEPKAEGQRGAIEVSSLDSLVGAHPDALRDLYRSGKVADPAELGESPRGRLLALEATTPLFMATRPLMAALASDWMPWKGKEFDHGGNSGTNVIVGKRLFRFRTEVVPSLLDGKPTFTLSYADKAFRNPWPARVVRDELRTVGSGVAIGPALIPWSGRWIPVLWFGLEQVRAA